MKYIHLYENFNIIEARAFIEKQTLKFVKEVSPNNIVNEKFITVYHGTSNANAKKIVKTSKFKAFTFFALDYDTAYKYSKINCGNASTVLSANVYAGSLLVSNPYLTSNEDVFLHSSFYVPNGYKFDWMK